MLGDGGPADCQPLGQFVDRARTPAQFFEKIAPIWIRNRIKGVNGHELTLIHSLETGKALQQAGPGMATP